MIRPILSCGPKVLQVSLAFSERFFRILEATSGNASQLPAHHTGGIGEIAI